jgi:hypothetical protein
MNVWAAFHTKAPAAIIVPRLDCDHETLIVATANKAAQIAARAAAGMLLQHTNQIGPSPLVALVLALGTSASV